MFGFPETAFSTPCSSSCEEKPSLQTLCRLRGRRSDGLNKSWPCCERIWLLIPWNCYQRFQGTSMSLLCPADLKKKQSPRWESDEHLWESTLENPVMLEMLIPSLLSVKLAKWRKSLLNVLGSTYEIWVLSSSKDCFYTVLSHFCALNRHTHTHIYIFLFFLFLSLSIVDSSVHCWGLNGGDGRRLELGPQVSVLTVAGEDTKRDKTFRCFERWRFEKGQLDVRNTPPLVVEVKKGFFYYHHTAIHIPHE